MAIVLGPNRYGKAETRLVRVSRDGETHSLADFNVSIALSGDLAALKYLIYAIILILMVLFNNAPIFRPLRENLSLKKLWARFTAHRSKPENIKDDDAAWNRIDTKIKMDELLSVDLQKNDAYTPDQPKKGDH